VDTLPDSPATPQVSLDTHPQDSLGTHHLVSPDILLRELPEPTHQDKPTQHSPATLPPLGATPLKRGATRPRRGHILQLLGATPLLLGATPHGLLTLMLLLDPPLERQDMTELGPLTLNKLATLHVLATLLARPPWRFLTASQGIGLHTGRYLQVTWDMLAG